MMGVKPTFTSTCCSAAVVDLMRDPVKLEEFSVVLSLVVFVVFG